MSCYLWCFVDSVDGVRLTARLRELSPLFAKRKSAFCTTLLMQRKIKLVLLDSTYAKRKSAFFCTTQLFFFPFTTIAGLASKWFISELLLVLGPCLDDRRKSKVESIAGLIEGGRKSLLCYEKWVEYTLFLSLACVGIRLKDRGVVRLMEGYALEKG